jgi:hypothetical protein
MPTTWPLAALVVIVAVFGLGILAVLVLAFQGLRQGSQIEIGIVVASMRFSVAVNERPKRDDDWRFEHESNKPERHTGPRGLQDRSTIPR